MKIYYAILIVMCCVFSQSISKEIDSLLNVYHSTNNQYSRAKLAAKISDLYSYSYPDSGIAFGKTALNLANSGNDFKSKGDAYLAMYWNYLMKHDFANSLICLSNSLQAYQQINDSLCVSRVYNNMAVVYAGGEVYQKALSNFNMALAWNPHKQENAFKADILNNSGELYLRINDLNSAEQCLRKALVIYDKL